MPKMTKEAFAKLQAKWYAKLAKSGFEDIEELVGSEWHLKSSDTHHCKYDPEVVRGAKQAYFESLRECVASQKFDNKQDKYVMKRLSEGATQKAIAEELRAKGYPCHRQSLPYTIRKYEVRWGIKNYPARKMQPQKGKRK